MTGQDSAQGKVYVLARSSAAAATGIATILWGLSFVVGHGAPPVLVLAPFVAGGAVFFVCEFLSDAVRGRMDPSSVTGPVRRDPVMGAARD